MRWKIVRINLEKIKYICICFLCLLTICNFSGCNKLKFINPEMRMESQLERKYHEKFKYVEDSLDGHGDSAFAFVWDTKLFSANYISENNPDIVVTCSYGEDFSDNYRDELIRKQFKELMYEYSSKYFTGNYYVWIEWDGKYELIDDSIEFEDYIKDDPSFSICIYVEDMDKEEAIKAGKRFVENNEKNGIYCDTYIGKNIGYDSELFQSWMDTNESNFSFWDEKIESFYEYSYIEKYRKQFRKLIEGYSRDFYVGEYYVWIDCKTWDRVGKTTFEEYIKDSERFDIYIFVKEMNDEDARKATEEFELFLIDKGIYNDCWGARNTEYSEDDFRKIMEDDNYKIEPKFEPAKFKINP